MTEKEGIKFRRVKQRGAYLSLRTSFFSLMAFVSVRPWRMSLSARLLISWMRALSIFTPYKPRHGIPYSMISVSTLLTILLFTLIHRKMLPFG